jgi:hypothetical protein
MKYEKLVFKSFLILKGKFLMSKKAVPDKNEFNSRRIDEFLRLAQEPPDEALLRRYFLSCTRKEVLPPLTDAERRWVTVNMDANPSWQQSWERLEKEFGRGADWRKKALFPASPQQRKQDSVNYPGTEDYRLPFISTSWRYAAAAAVLLFALYGTLWFAGRATLPETYPMASLNGYEETLSNQIRSKTAKEDEFSKGIEALLGAQESTLGLFPHYNPANVSEAIAHLNQAFDSAIDPFQRAEIAFFIGKAYLMRADKMNAKYWFEEVLVQNVADYREEAVELIGELKIEK